MNLIGRSTETQIWERHIEDSGQILSLIRNYDQTIADVGTGGGFPGVVMSICGCPHMTLIEADQKKCVFLREVKRALGLYYDVLESRVEDIVDKRYDLIVSRAMSPIKSFLETTRAIRHSYTNVIMYKGKSFQEELNSAFQNWSFSYTIHSSQTSQDGVLIVMSEIDKKLD